MSAIVGIGALALLVGGIILFKDNIASFVSGGLTDVGENIAKGGGEIITNIQSGIDETGKAIDTSIKETQTNIDNALTNASTAVTTTINQAQTNFDNNIAGINQGAEQVVTDLDQFAKDSQQNIVDSINNINKTFSDGLTDIFSIFGGQQTTKQVITSIPSVSQGTNTGTGSTTDPFKATQPDKSLLSPFITGGLK
ncbi:hypothetical protein ES702_02799 [subsurface metagenome]